MVPDESSSLIFVPSHLCLFLPSFIRLRNTELVPQAKPTHVGSWWLSKPRSHASVLSSSTWAEQTGTEQRNRKCGGWLTRQGP